MSLRLVLPADLPTMKSNLCGGGVGDRVSFFQTSLSCFKKWFVYRLIKIGMEAKKMVDAVVIFKPRVKGWP